MCYDAMMRQSQHDDSEEGEEDENSFPDRHMII